MSDVPRPPHDRSGEPLGSSAASTQAARQRIGERVRAARLAAHLTQEELARQAYSKSYLSALESGRMTPSFQALGTLAERLGVTRSFLLGEEVTPAHRAGP
jgi:transcriptional regulator with XRE-family HTH domain